MSLCKILHIFSICCFVLLAPSLALSATPFANIFGYSAEQQHDMNYLPQWLSVLERHIVEDVPEGNCSDTLFNQCHLKRWYEFLASIKNKPTDEQINAVNNFANKKKYVLDMDNYGMPDYWAIAREFFYKGGDCEDYAITKFFSLRWLGYDKDLLRIIILQDANLRVHHAILAVFYKNDVLILDNQTKQVISHKEIKHYLPLFSVNEKKWWLHLPPM